jgi:hypothetical protein
MQAEGAALFRHHRVKQDLQQEITQLFSKASVVAALERIVHLVRLFDQVGSERLVCLRRVPVATASQIAHERKRIFKRGFHLLGLR